MRATVIAAKARDFPTIPRAELENAYGDVRVDALKRTFGSAELAQNRALEAGAGLRCARRWRLGDG
jgi:hypothetical protein